MVVATTATKRITAEAMPAMVLGLGQRTGLLTFQPHAGSPHHADRHAGLDPRPETPGSARPVGESSGTALPRRQGGLRSSSLPGGAAVCTPVHG